MIFRYAIILGITHNHLSIRWNKCQLFMGCQHNTVVGWWWCWSRSKQSCLGTAEWWSGWALFDIWSSLLSALFHFLHHPPMSQIPHRFKCAKNIKLTAFAYVVVAGFVEPLQHCWTSELSAYKEGTELYHTELQGSCKADIPHIHRACD